MPMRPLMPGVVQSQTLVSLPPTATVRAATKVLAEHNIGAVLVMDGEELVGIFTERDLVKRVAAVGRDLDTTLLQEVMTANPDTLAPNARAYEAFVLMQDRGYRHIPVVEAGRVVAVVSIRDLFLVIKRQLLEAVQQREEFIFGSGYSAGVQPEVTPEKL